MRENIGDGDFERERFHLSGSVSKLGMSYLCFFFYVFKINENYTFSFFFFIVFFVFSLWNFSLLFFLFAISYEFLGGSPAS